MAYLSQLHGATDEISTDDEQYEPYDEQLDYLDKTLDYINIIKINTSCFKKNKNIKNQDDLENAEGIIDEITNGRKRKSSCETNAPNAKNARIDPNLSIPSETVKATQGHQHRVKQLFLQPQVMDMLKQKGVNFEVHLYLVENHVSSKFSKAFSEIVTKECKQKLCQEKEVTKSYMLFFYRNVKKGKFFTPEIYALTTGFAWRFAETFAEMNFAKHVERRVLRFPCLKFHYDLIDGHISSISKLARPGHEITFTTWDFLGILVKNRTRQIRENSSLYSSEIDAFVTQTGKHIPTKFQVGKNKLKIQRKLKLSQLGRLLDHFSKIDSNKNTYLINDKIEEEEKDNPLFQMYDFVSRVTEKELRENLDKKLNNTLQDSMDGKNSNIYLMHKKKSKWSKADEFSLRYLDESASGPKKKHYKTIKKWNVFPKLDDVMRALKVEYAPKFQPEWLDNVIIEFGNTKAALKECIFSRFIVGGIGTYIYNHGEWIEMTAEYLYCIETEFVEMLKPHLLKPSDLPMLLPWKHRKINTKRKTKEKKIERKFDDKIRTMKSKWKDHYLKVCKRVNFEKSLKKLRKLSEGKTDPICDFQKLKEMRPETKAAHLYRFLESELTEDGYNSLHTLLNMILQDSSDTKVITCDETLSNGIELCDIMIFDKIATYLVHVKAHFNGKSIRAVCSQIKNAADFIYREITLGKGTGIIDQYWKELTKTDNNPQTHENEVKKVLKNMTKERFKEKLRAESDIIFVLACRDFRENADFSEDGFCSFSVNIEEEIQTMFGEKSAEMIAKLKEEGFLTVEGDVTNTFILEGKNNKGAFIAKIKQWECIKNEKTARNVSEVLMSGLSKSKATIAKMEIMRLIEYFERYYVGERKLQLRVLSINKDFP